MHTIGIDHLNLGFPSDRLDEVIDFYVDTLGFETDFEDPHVAVRDDPGLFSIRLGDTYQLYVHPTEDFDSDAMNYRHVALRIPESPDALREFFEREGGRHRPHGRARERAVRLLHVLLRHGPVRIHGRVHGCRGVLVIEATATEKRYSASRLGGERPRERSP